MTKKILFITLLMFTMTILTGNDLEAFTKEQDVITLKISFVTPMTHPHGVMASRLAEVISEKSKGKMKLAVFPAGQLGGEREIIEAMQIGNIDLAITTTAIMMQFVPPVSLIELPFLFKSPSHYDKVLSGPIGERLLKEMDRSNLKGVMFLGGGAFRHVMNSKRPIDNVESMKGLK